MLPAPDLVIRVNPARGAKITSLVDADGTEWLAQAAGPEIPPPGTSFVDAEMAGWDECAPTVTDCVIDGAPIPDHGDAWDRAWVGVGEGLRHTGTSLPYVLERTVTPTPAGGLRLSYRATTTAASVPFLWVGHPQFAAPPGTRIEFPRPPGRVVDVLAEGHPVLPWSDDLGAVDRVPTGSCAKLYVHPDERVPGADLVRPDGNRLRLTWSANVPYLGLWYDVAAVAPAPVVAIEPALGYFDSLAVAAGNGTAPVLTPGSPLEWWLELHRP